MWSSDCNYWLETTHVYPLTLYFNCLMWLLFCRFTRVPMHCFHLITDYRSQSVSVALLWSSAVPPTCGIMRCCSATYMWHYMRCCSATYMWGHEVLQWHLHVALWSAAVLNARTAGVVAVKFLCELEPISCRYYVSNYHVLNPTEF